MDLRRLRAGEWLAAISGVALLVSLFLPWYEAAGPSFDAKSGRSTYTSLAGNVTGWESMSGIDVLLAFIAASAVLLAIVTANQRVPAVPIALSALVALFGMLGVILVLVRLLDLPDWASGRDWAIWLAFVGSVGIVAGSFLAMREEIRPGAPEVHVETLPAPGP